MKTIYTLSLWVLMSTNLFAQNITNNRPFHKANNNDTVKPIYDSICEWIGPGYSPPAGSTPYIRTLDFVYDANGNLHSDVEQEIYNYSVGLQNAVKVNNTYLSNNLISTSITQSWSGSAWVNSSQNIYSYTIGDSINTLKKQQWRSNAWVDTTLTTYYYNINNSDSCILTQAWNGSTWLNYSHSLYYYNANNLDTSTLQQTWVDSTASWANNSKYNYFYNANNLDTLTITSYWWHNTWNPYYKYFYTYDTNNNLIRFDYWDNNAGWIDLADERFTYDSENRLLTSFYFYNPPNYDSVHYYYHPGDINKNNPVISVYPNPSALTFTIDNGDRNYTNCTIDVYNMLGQDVYKTTCANFNAPSQISLTDPNGIYILRFLSDQGNFYRKLVIKN